MVVAGVGRGRGARVVQLVRARVSAVRAGCARRVAQGGVAEREETIKTTYVVFIFAIVMGLFFWVLDWVLTWLIRLLTGQPPA